MQEYAYLPHSVSSDKNTYYCRALNSVLPLNTMFCSDCPLLRGWSQGDNQKLPTCCYFDCHSGNNESPKAIKKRIDREILLNRIGEFPYFDCEKIPLHKTLEPALQFAAKAHKGAFRKGTSIPYIAHPMEAASIAAKITDNPVVITAAALHDVLEDTPYLPQDIEEYFGRDVLELVLQESENKREDINPQDSWRIRKKETLTALAQAPREAQIVALADKLSNMRQMKRDYMEIGDKLWDKFNRKDPAAHAWYYRSIADILKNTLENTAAYQEYATLMQIVFAL